MVWGWSRCAGFGRRRPIGNAMGKSHCTPWLASFWANCASRGGLVSYVRPLCRVNTKHKKSYQQCTIGVILICRVLTLRRLEVIEGKGASLVWYRLRYARISPTGEKAGPGLSLCCKASKSTLVVVVVGEDLVNEWTMSLICICLSRCADLSLSLFVLMVPNN